AHQAGECRGAAAIEIAFEPVADRLVQHHARPARPEHDVHFTGGGRPRLPAYKRPPPPPTRPPLPPAPPPENPPPPPPPHARCRPRARHSRRCRFPGGRWSRRPPRH